MQKFLIIDIDSRYEGKSTNPDFPEADKWRVSLSYLGREIKFPYFMGPGHNGAPPTLDMVLDCLFSDAIALEMDFSDWCREYGYEEDSRTAYRVFNECQDIGYKLEYLFEDDYEEIRNEVLNY